MVLVVLAAAGVTVAAVAVVNRVAVEVAAAVLAAV